MNQRKDIGSNAIILNSKGEILLVKRSDTDKYFPGEWELPGGGVDFTETPQESLKREVLEECGLTVAVGKPLGVHRFEMEENGVVIAVSEVTFLCTLTSPAQAVTVSHEHSAYRWIVKKEIENFQVNEYMKNVLQDALENI